MISPMRIRDSTRREAYASISRIEEVDSSFALELRRARERNGLAYVQRPKDKSNGEFLVDVNEAIRLYVEMHPIRTEEDALRVQLLVGMSESYALGSRLGWTYHSPNGQKETRVRRCEGKKLEMVVKEGNNHVPALFALTEHVQRWWEEENFVDDTPHVRVGQMGERRYVPFLDVVAVSEVAAGADISNPDYVTKIMSEMARARPGALELRFFDRQRLGKKGGPYGLRAMSVLYFTLRFPRMGSQFTSRSLAERVFYAPKGVVEEAFEETGISPRGGKAYSARDIRTLFGKVFMGGIQKYI